MSFTGLWNKHIASLCLFQSRSSNICGCEAFYDHFMVVSIYPAWSSVSIATFNPTCVNEQQTKTFHNLPCAPVRITGNQKTNISKTFFKSWIWSGLKVRLKAREERRHWVLHRSHLFLSVLSRGICFPDCILIMSYYNTIHTLHPGDNSLRSHLPSPLGQS